MKCPSPAYLTVSHVGNPLEEARALFLFCMSPPELGTQVGGTQIRRALIRRSGIFLVLENGPGKCASLCVEVFAPLKSVTKNVTQATWGRKTTCTKLLPVSSVKC